MRYKTIFMRISLALIVLAYIAGGLLFSSHNPVLALVRSLEQELSKTTPTPTPVENKVTDNAVKPIASNSSQSQSASQAMNKTVPVLNKARSVGIFVTNSPDDPTALATLDKVSALGFDTVYNYASFHSPPEQVNQYLDHAQARGLKVIFSLKDLYNELPGSEQWPQNFSYYGSNNEEIALNVVRKFKDHPATWGFSIADETPESPAELAAWQGILTNRYQKIKGITTKPVMMVLVGHISSNDNTRRNFLNSLKGARDSFALDYYPVPYESIDSIALIGADLPAVGDNNGWFVAQSFSWSSYGSTANGLGYSVGLARLPTTSEMVSMARLALNAGARNILFYSYFDIKDNPAQLTALKNAVRELR